MLFNLLMLSFICVSSRLLPAKLDYFCSAPSKVLNIFDFDAIEDWFLVGEIFLLECIRFWVVKVRVISYFFNEERSIFRLLEDSETRIGSLICCLIPSFFSVLLSAVLYCFRELRVLISKFSFLEAWTFESKALWM